MFKRLALLAFIAMTSTLHAQQIKSEPGHFDFYELNLSWAPEFCANMNTLTADEKAAAGSDMDCTAPHGFVLHGLWPQNFDGTYPASCSDRPGPRNIERNLDMTPNVALLRHEWAKHGTCTTLSPEAFFATARFAYKSITMPREITELPRDTDMSPAQILTAFYRVNPTFPQGSFAISCKENRLTAVEACFSKEGTNPIACKGVPTCAADKLLINAPNDSGIVK